MESLPNNALFSSGLWERALESYASAAHLTVKLFDADGRVVFGPIHPTPFFSLFQETTGYEPGLFAECARRCLAQTNGRPAVMVREFCGLSVVGTSLVLDGKKVGAAVGGYAFVDFSQLSEVRRLAQNSGISFERLWQVAREQKPVPQQRLVLNGELLQVLGDALLRENYHTRKYEQTVLTLQETAREKDQFKNQLAEDYAGMRRLHEISTRLVGHGGLQILLEEILEAALEITGANLGNIQLLDRATGVLRIAAQRGFEREFLDFFNTVHKGLAACGTAIETGQRVIVKDVVNDPIFKGTPACDVMIRAGALAVQSTPLVSRSGEILGMFSTHYRSPRQPGERDLQRLDLLARQAADLIERKQVENERGRLAAIVDSSADAIVSKDLNGTILSWNYGAERLFGYTPEEAIGQPATMLVPPDRADEEPRIFERIRRGERIEHYETIRRRKDGTLLDISLTVSPILDENGQVVGASKIARDITDAKTIEQERREMAVTSALRKTEAELARVARALTVGELATSIAHEVNQPLAAVVTNAEACLRWLGGKAPNLPEAQESLALIVRDAHRASKVIRRIREFLKKDPQQIEPLDINEVAKETLDLARDELQKSHVTLRVELSDGLPTVLGDRIQLQQVMLNLIMNGRDAVAAVEDGSRELVMISQKSGADGVRIAVRDSGSGAAPEDLDRLFEAFFTTKPAGIGMGLSISRSIIEAHGGRIWAELNDGPGLTVQFNLPVESESL